MSWKSSDTTVAFPHATGEVTPEKLRRHCDRIQGHVTGKTPSNSRHGHADDLRQLYARRQRQPSPDAARLRPYGDKRGTGTLSACNTWAMTSLNNQSTPRLHANIIPISWLQGHPRLRGTNDGWSADLAHSTPLSLQRPPDVNNNQPGVSSASPSLRSVSPPLPNGKTLRHIWLRSKVRFRPRIHHVGTLHQLGDAYKLWKKNRITGMG